MAATKAKRKPRRPASVTPADNLVARAWAFPESLAHRADGWINGGNVWHGWALREAYIAGAASVTIRERGRGT